MATINGTSGNDTLYGTPEPDTINGNSGNDYIFGDDGDDTLNGGLGNDTLDGGNGNDTVDYSTATSKLNINLATGIVTNPSSGGVDTLISIENVLGGSGAETIVGNDADNALWGGGGNDTMTGGLGNDQIYGQSGADTITVISGQGSDTVNGGTGSDTMVLELKSSDITSALRADMSSFNTWMQGQLAANGGVSGMAALSNGPTFTFYSLGLTVSLIETVTVKVDGVTVPMSTLFNHAPVINGGGEMLTDEDVVINGLVNATDVDGDTLSFALTEGPANGAVSLNAATGQYTYTPALN
jgi:Ca2+-binding RTX toxin-like protein